MNLSESLFKLFGSKSRVALLQLFLNNQTQTLRVKDVITKSGVNSRLVSTELKKMAQIGILTRASDDNATKYKANQDSPLLKPLKEILLQKEWFEWERPSHIHHLVLTLEAGLKPMFAYYGHCLSEAHLVFNYDNVTWFFRLEDFKEVGRALIPLYQKRKAKIWRDFHRYASTLQEHNSYGSFYKNYRNFWKVAYLTEPISFYIDSLLEPNEHISIGGRSFIDEYEDRLRALVEEAKKKGINAINVKPVVRDFFWIKNSYHSTHRLSEEEVRLEVKKRLVRRRPKSGVAKDPTSIPQYLLKIGKDMILMQDQRKKYMMQAAHYLHEFLKKVGEKHNLSPTLMAQTLPSEVLNRSALIPKLRQELNQRQKSCTIIGSLSDGIKVYSGQTIFPKGVSKTSKLEIKGKVACGGKAAGRAKIVYSLNDLYKVNHGDIIVSPMTTPDLITAIRKCVAIVTDFGGITCHAAIVAREFNLPCVIGTNTATKEIKDNDLVEVDADNGIVRMLYRN